MKPIIAASAIALALTSPATAGDWTGFYGGAQLGYGSGGTSSSSNTFEGPAGGLHIGADYDLGDWVVGAEFAYDWAHLEYSLPLPLEISRLGQLKVRAGYDLGPGLIYGVAGLARVRLENTNSGQYFEDSGYAFGLGYEHMLTDRISVGAEYLHSQFNNFKGGTTDLDFDTVEARVSFRF